MTPDDVLVVGAGPAGAVAALVLARAGVPVRLLDRADFPRHKLCGDTINPGSLAILDALDRGGVAAADEHGPESPREPRAGERRPEGALGALVRRQALAIAGMTVTGPDGTRVAADYPDGFQGAALSRHTLDQLLLTAALDAGARFESGVRVTAPVTAPDGSRVTGVRVSSRGGEAVLRARVIIAGDGRRSTIASALKLSRPARRWRRWAFGAYFEGVGALEARGEMHVRADGYLGIAPLPGGVANVCLVRDLSTIGSSSDPARMVMACVAQDPLLRERFARARQVSEIAALGPLAIETRAAGCPGLLLAGDSAGFVDPMTGDGLRFALRGGELAARAALWELETGRAAFTSLRAAHAREFGGKWRFNRTLRAVVDSPAAIALAAQVAARWRYPVCRLVEVAGDVRLARALARRE